MGHATETVYKPSGATAPVVLPDIGTIYFFSIRFSVREKFREWPAMVVRHLSDSLIKIVLLTDVKIHHLEFVISQSGAMGAVQKGITVERIKYAEREAYLDAVRDISPKLMKAVKS